MQKRRKKMRKKKTKKKCAKKTQKKKRRKSKKTQKKKRRERKKIRIQKKEVNYSFFFFTKVNLMPRQGSWDWHTKCQSKIKGLILLYNFQGKTLFYDFQLLHFYFKKWPLSSLLKGGDCLVIQIDLRLHYFTSSFFFSE